MAVIISNGYFSSTDGYTLIIQPPYVARDSTLTVYVGDAAIVPTSGTNLYYKINGGSTQTLASNIQGTSCTNRGTITNLRPSDIITFFSGTGGTTQWRLTSANDTAVCPAIAGTDVERTYTIPPSADNNSYQVAITIDSDTAP